MRVQGNTDGNGFLKGCDPQPCSTELTPKPNGEQDRI